MNNIQKILLCVFAGFGLGAFLTYAIIYDIKTGMIMLIALLLMALIAFFWEDNSAFQLE